ncbi:SDR family NAD(P)-dependent oxidoreductase [Microbacterium pygmaeum]|uniref:NAD(P)-dependent dehydrogenase, short-chain alcohol dehydrogenase family n=1 Tax=Microbacterium pygmaeum TaxID=370764 RepID=A0A1G7XC92_9MICO|nr:SDR family oxidoreductase [Microbacterium pygmaeum]SDG81829.1 NAD(P)-dependent dehydrogenase, short-chain alcohol dehydrogenase family [Microbacterium pygmaeum]
MGLLDGQVALITGGGRGLGRAISLALAAEGASVAIDDIFRDENGVSVADEVVAEIEAIGARGLALRENVTTSEGASAMVAQTVEKFGRLDILVMCAGNMVRGKLEDLTEEQWDGLMSLHVKGHFLACKYAIPQMKKQNSGSIITVSSRGAFFQVPASKTETKDLRQPPSTVYSAAKAAIMGLTTTLAVELWETGIRVNSLLPSATTQLFPESKPRMVGGVPPSESLDPADVAPAVVFLSTPAAKNISGKFVYASGGDIIVYGDQLDVRGSRMVRKHGRWDAAELADVLPSLLGVPVGE